MTTGVAIIGCGFVADYYMSCLPLHRDLQVVGGHDLRPQRSAEFAAHHSVNNFPSLDAALADPGVQIVLNLTSPPAHVEVSRRALEAGKHVYSEKPIALSYEDAASLIEIARSNGVQFSSAPCCPLGESAQTTIKAIRDGAIGKVRLAYAEVDDGLFHRTPHARWKSESGAPWPVQDESHLGCVRAHGGYAVSRLAAMFGPVRRVEAFSTRVVDDHGVETQGTNGHANAYGPVGPDFGVAVLRFDDGVVARLTLSTLAPRDRSLRVFGDEGVLSTADCSDDRSPVHVRHYYAIRRRLMLSPWSKRVKLLRSGQPKPRYRGAQQRDFMRGVAELAAAVREGRESRLSPAFVLHTNEVVLAIHAAATGQPAQPIRSTFQPLNLMPWAA